MSKVVHEAKHFGISIFIFLNMIHLPHRFCAFRDFRLWNNYNSPSCQSPESHTHTLYHWRKSGVVLETKISWWDSSSKRQFWYCVVSESMTVRRFSTWKKQQAIMTHKMIFYLGQVYSSKGNIELNSDVMRLDSSNLIKKDWNKTDIWKLDPVYVCICKIPEMRFGNQIHYHKRTSTARGIINWLIPNGT